MKKWVNGYAPMFNIQGVKIATVPERAVVISHGYVEDFRGTPRESVSYGTNERQFTGFIYTGYLETYWESLPSKCVRIDSATPSLSDAEQYAVVPGIPGVKQTNLCGQLCAAYLLGVSLEDVLAEWEQDYQPIYRRVFNWYGSRLAGGTGPEAIQSMLSAFNRSSKLLTYALYDPILKGTQYSVRYTVSGLKAFEGRAIVGVKINKMTGRFASSGILHWVVVTAVIPERTGYGGVEIYNPFPNRIEAYSWSEFIAAAGVPYGVVLDG